MVLLFMFQSQGFIPSSALATTEYFEVETRLRYHSVILKVLWLDIKRILIYVIVVSPPSYKW